MVRKKPGHGAAGIIPNAPIGGELIRGWDGICAEIDKSRVQIWRDIRAGRFPAPIELGPNSIAWFKSEVETWKASRPRRTYGAAVAIGAEAL
jgi:predicted DNA-binding transcriptional regulator AlpA